MVGKFKVITLCGSTKFKDQFIAEQKRLTLEGNIVISVGLFGHSGDDEVWAEGTKEMLDEIHKAKIDMADEIFVINVYGYIGKSTQNEIAYAIKTGKHVNYYYENPNSMERTKSSEQVNIPDGKYRGLWSAYEMVVLLPDWTETPPIKMNGGVKGLNCKSTVEAKGGWLYVD